MLKCLRAINFTRNYHGTEFVPFLCSMPKWHTLNIPYSEGFSSKLGEIVQIYIHFDMDVLRILVTSVTQHTEQVQLI